MTALTGIIRRQRSQGAKIPLPSPVRERLIIARLRRISAANCVETAAAIDASRDPVARRRFDDLVREFVIEPVTAAQARIAREACCDFGRGSGHPAKLNFGDCFAYSLARETGEPLLFKGKDLARTDIRPAVK